MPMWLCRAGRYGEFENKFLEDSKVYCTWDNLSESIMQFHTKQDLQQYFVDNNPDVKVKTAMNWASQVWPFAHEMKKGEIVVLPSKIKGQASWHVCSAPGWQGRYRRLRQLPNCSSPSKSGRERQQAYMPCHPVPSP